jgi:branched-chain amino acid transport system ATP-binding protein
MALLEAQGISVSFGGLRALSDVTLHVEEGAVTGLIGPNGAGKSTMLGVLSGLLRPRAGRVAIDGRDVTRLPPHRRARLGLARTFQRLELWTSMTVAENVLTAAELASSWHTAYDPRAVARDVIDRLGLGAVADRSVNELSSGQGRLVEVARAMAMTPRVLMLDEPSAGLNEVETQDLGATLSAMAAGGVAILMVEHHVELVTATCADVYVLDFGETIAHGPPDAIRRDAGVQKAYLGGRHSAAVA